MEIALLGSRLGRSELRALAAAGFREVSAQRASVRIWVSPRPPARPPRAPWIWVATRTSSRTSPDVVPGIAVDLGADEPGPRTELRSSEVHGVRGIGGGEADRVRGVRGIDAGGELDRVHGGGAIGSGEVERVRGGRVTGASGDLDRVHGGRATSASGDLDRVHLGRVTSASGDLDPVHGGRVISAGDDLDRVHGGRVTSAGDDLDRVHGGRATSAGGDLERVHGGHAIVAGGEVDPIDAATAILAGAYDAIALGPELPRILARRCAELAIATPSSAPPPAFVATSASARRVLAELDQAAHTSMAVLLTGETGTGKDLAARYLHMRSGRRGELVPINCAAIPNELIEGELFGYVRGAFSGAVADYDGLIRAATGGTVFLDEVDDTPKTLQIKLLRVLEDHVLSRLGESVWREVDFRIVAATNRDLDELVQRGEFGADLYQRLAIVRIVLPPLRDRAEDLPELVGHLIARYYREDPAAPHRVVQVTSAALTALRKYPWPGNVRELRNVVFHALVRKRGGTELLLSDLPEHVVRGAPRADVATAVVDRAALAKMIDNGRMNLRATRDQLERVALELALARAGGSPARAARLLGEVGRGSARDPAGTVRAMMRRHGLG